MDSTRVLMNRSISMSSHADDVSEDNDELSHPFNLTKMVVACGQSLPTSLHLLCMCWAPRVCLLNLGEHKASRHYAKRHLI